MPVTDKDIYASAQIFIKQHGNNALSEALAKMDQFQEKGDLEGRECWNKIAAAIKWMQDDRGVQCH